MEVSGLAEAEAAAAAEKGWWGRGWEPRSESEKGG